MSILNFCPVERDIINFADDVETIPSIKMLDVEQLTNAVWHGASFYWTDESYPDDIRIASRKMAKNALEEECELINQITDILETGDAIAAGEKYDSIMKDLIRNEIQTAVDDFQQWPDDFDFDFYLKGGE